jgi:allantoinase
VSGFTPKRLVETLAHGPARAFGLQRKGRLAAGYDADLVLVDPAAHAIIRHQDLHDRASYSPYETRAVSGKVTHVYRRGELVVEEGNLLDRTPAQRVSTA